MSRQKNGICRHTFFKKGSQGPFLGPLAGDGRRLVKWQNKKKLARGVSNPELDSIYELARKNGALGGKISGAGGGGFFTFYCEENQDKLRSVMKKEGMRELKFDFDFEGTKILANFMNYSPLPL